MHACRTINNMELVRQQRPAMPAPILSRRETGTVTVIALALCRQCALTIQSSQHSNCPLCRAPIVHVHFFGGEDSLGGPRPQRKRAAQTPQLL